MGGTWQRAHFSALLSLRVWTRGPRGKETQANDGSRKWGLAHVQGGCGDHREHLLPPSIKDKGGHWFRGGPIRGCLPGIWILNTKTKKTNRSSLISRQMSQMYPISFCHLGHLPSPSLSCPSGAWSFSFSFCSIFIHSPGFTEHLLCSLPRHCQQPKDADGCGVIPPSLLPTPCSVPEGKAIHPNFRNEYGSTL